MEFPSKFELHYYFADASHSMNALVRNKCEAEFLAVAAEVADILGIHFELDCEALKEGGIREVWKALGEHSSQIALIISTLTLIWSAVPKQDHELIDLQKEDLRLSIEQRKKALGKIKEDVENNSVTSETIESAANIASRSYKVVTRKSNFYKVLSMYEKVIKLGYSELDAEGKALCEERTVNHQDFPKFILTSHDLEPFVDSSAHIEIVAPVLIDGKAKWKGVYDGQLISFSMNDKEFKMAVISKQLSFKNGDGIVCVLHIHKKLDEIGEVVTAGYSVEVVLENVQSGMTTETAQGRRFRHTKKLQDGQSDMFES